MRSLALFVGLCVALAGLLVAAYQGILWVVDGYWMDLQFGDLWSMLGVAPLHFPGLGALNGIAAWLLGQPLWAVLPFIGGFIAWFGTAGIGRAVEGLRVR
jgi:hypothetical protein